MYMEFDEDVVAQLDRVGCSSVGLKVSVANALEQRPMASRNKLLEIIQLFFVFF